MRLSLGDMEVLDHAQLESGSPPLQCCCGSADCVHLKKNCSILEAVEKDVHTAAQLGKVCVCVDVHMSAGAALGIGFAALSFAELLLGWAFFHSLHSSLHPIVCPRRQMIAAIPFTSRSNCIPVRTRQSRPE